MDGVLQQDRRTIYKKIREKLALMTLDWIIQKLKTNGKGTKQEVLQALETATDKDLYELQRSINSELVNRALKKVKK